MPENGNLPHIRDLASVIAELRAIIAKSREALEQPMPDMFLGRKTQEPFPQQKE
jgi:hypothetical protein